MESPIYLLVESADALAAVRRKYDGQGVFVHTHAPFVQESLQREGASVAWLQDYLPPDAPEKLGYAAVRAVDLLQPDLQAIGQELGLPTAMHSMSMTLQRTISSLFYKKALFDLWCESTKGRQIVVGCTTLTPLAGPDITLDRFDTLFAVFAAREAERGPEIFEFSSAIDRAKLYAEVDQGHWLDRLISFADVSRGQLTYRVSRYLHGDRPLGRRNSYPCVTILHPNEAIREMLPELLRTGARVSFYAPRRPRLRALDVPSTLPSQQRITEILQESARGLDYLNVQSISEILASRMAAAARLWRSAVEEADEEAEAVVAKNSPQVVLSNSVGGFSGAALVASLQRRNIKFVMAEHGVSAGLCGLHESTRAYGEPCGADAYLVCSPNAADFFRQEPALRSVITVPIGLPRQTRTVPTAYLQRFLVRRRFGVRRNQRLIMYVATPFQNSMRMIPHSAEDPEIQCVMRTMAHDILPHVRGVPVIKLYATRRHQDPDPLIGAFPPPKKVQVCKAGDFRYMRAGADVIIFDLPLSTVGWAFGSGKPIFFLYQPRWHLLPGVEAALESALFLIRTDNECWANQLKEMLNWDEGRLAQEWDAKQAGRRAFLDRYAFGSENPGKRGAEFLCGFTQNDRALTERAT